MFVALAVLVSHRDVILRYLVEVRQCLNYPVHMDTNLRLAQRVQFDEVLKYCNELSMTIELDSTLAQAEVLFLSFSQMVADIDRRQAERDAASAPGSSAGLRRRRGERGEGNDALSNVEMPEINEYLRELLDSGNGKQRSG